MDIHAITIFPEMYRAVTESGVIARAFREKRVSLRCWNPRDYTTDVHRTVDDRPYGGGPGMVMRYEPLSQAVEAAKAAAGQAKAPRVIGMSPQGVPLTQERVQEYAGMDSVILVPGRYEGMDERFVERHVDEECSIGDYVLSGGELASMVWIDAVVRCLPGVLGNTESLAHESFMNGLLDCPHYTRPERVADSDVPPTLLSGDHEAIRRWRLKASLGRTWLKRPDLLVKTELTGEMRELLEEFKHEFNEFTGREEQ